MEMRKVGVLGLGHVGAHVAYSLIIQGIVSELVLVDVKEGKLASEVQDLRDAQMYAPHKVVVNPGTYADLGDCDIIVNCIGDITLCASNNRLDEMSYTVAQVKSYIGKVMASGFKGYIVNITNPCDVIAHLLWKESGLPKNQVFGTGTGLDTSRLVSKLSLQTGVAHQSISAYMIGEHGASQM
ncbi:MAG: L-lactate dehydrogenase, partial [Phascolarctobacterium sp.]